MAALVLVLAVAAAVAAGCGGDAAPAPEPGPEPSPGAFVREPYLTRVGETSARLRWIARGDAPVRIEAVAGDGPPVVAREGVLTGLRPDTRYRWTASVDGAEASEGTLTTAPTTLEGPLELLAFGDYGAPNDDFRAVAALAASLQPRLLVTAGDNAYLVALPQLLDAQIFRPLRGVLAHAPNYGVVGDHDIVFRSGRRALVGAFEWPGGGGRYDLRYGPVQVVGLGLRGDEADVAFARRALARPGPLARLVTVHQPIQAGNPLLEVIAAADVTAVLAGHLHAYERRVRPEAPGVPFLTVGTGGAPRNDDRTPRSDDAVVHLAEFGLLRVRLQAERATYEF
ncbi:MAG TPA: hypothetical protein VK904_05025, partial [Miltoncostaeaceae bacterium]|nr:hypothetical protein [Miltoncostaeaceae bacterium]